MIRDLFSPAPRPEVPAKGKGKPSPAKPGGLAKDTTPPAPTPVPAKPKAEEPAPTPQPIVVAEATVVETGKPAASAKPEPAKPTPAKPEPVKPEPAKPEPSKPVAVEKPVAQPKPAEPVVVAQKTPEPAKPVETAKPAAAEEKPAAKPAEAPKKAPPLGKRPKDPTGSAEYDVRAWAAAWAAQDVKAYLAHYGSEFKPPKGRKRAAWEEERRDRISRAEFIRVELLDLKIAHKGGAIAKAKFRQHYQSNILDNTTGKTLVLKKQGEAWKIIGEF
jgi:hypothetical protein